MLTAKAARVNKGLTQAYCAEQLGIDRGTYIKYENGTSSPSVADAKRIANLLDRSLDEIVFLPKI